ncbi:MAG: type II toxin-antitoxin system RelB/DinJ family antitoxin [Oscillospiraceae bacterium]|jgi:addiction module RelB/DinJ family antitoxin|nr:type II toxin-antitoxin system RelB/DinJ family antitoxin [Oscillospiraceae bacterium]
MKTATIAVRVDESLKAELEELFASLGMTLSEAISIFLHKAKETRGIPFRVARPVTINPSPEDVAAMLNECDDDDDAQMLSPDEFFAAVQSRIDSLGRGYAK